MQDRLYNRDPLSPGEREEYETGLISFSDCELDLLGDVEGLHVLYAGGASLLWIEGLAERVGEGGTVTALELDPECVDEARELLREMDFPAPVRVVRGSVFDPPFPPNTFDLAYSAGLFHELDVRDRPATDALAALVSVVRPGGRVATSDFVDAVPAVQLEDEELQRELAREAHDANLYGIGPPDRIVSLHNSLLAGVGWRVSPPHHVRHLDKMTLAEEEPGEIRDLPSGTRDRLRERRQTFRERIRREGYTRPATLYVEGTVR